MNNQVGEEKNMWFSWGFNEGNMIGAGGGINHVTLLVVIIRSNVIP